MRSLTPFYPLGEKAYNDCYQTSLFSSNPYRYRVLSPYGNSATSFTNVMQSPRPQYHATSVQQTIRLNAALNAEAQSAINAKEPSFDIWHIDELDSSMSKLNISDTSSSQVDEKGRPLEKGSSEKRQSVSGFLEKGNAAAAKSSRFAGFKKALAMKTPEEKAASNREKMSARSRELRDAILAEENGRWPDEEWRQ